MSLKKIVMLLTVCLIFTYAYDTSIYANETGGKQETSLTKKIDTKDLSGINLWIAELYNEDKVLYAVVVTFVMAILGSVMAFGTDLVLKYFGMSVSKISHSE